MLPMLKLHFVRMNVILKAFNGFKRKKNCNTC